MAGTSHDGIQKLLAAEQEAQKIVTAAREGKTARLKQAKQEAENEIAAYRASLESAFQQRLREETGNSGANFDRLESETRNNIATVKNMSASKGREVIDVLVQMVTTVKAN